MSNGSRVSASNSMNKKSLRILEQAFEAEIEGAIGGRPRIFQTKSKTAQELVTSGHLEEDSFTLPGRFPVVVKGYVLTHLGRIEYCSTCDE